MSLARHLPFRSKRTSLVLGTALVALGLVHALDPGPVFVVNPEGTVHVGPSLLQARHRRTSLLSASMFT